MTPLALVIDHEACWGCLACEVACKQENNADAGVKLVGIDYISAEQYGAPAPRTHRILLGKGIPIVEGLDLSDVPAGDYDLVVLPIKVKGHEGAPARAIVRKQ